MQNLHRSVDKEREQLGETTNVTGISKSRVTGLHVYQHLDLTALVGNWIETPDMTIGTPLAQDRTKAGECSRPRPEGAGQEATRYGCKILWLVLSYRSARSTQPTH